MGELEGLGGGVLVIVSLVIIDVVDIVIMEEVEIVAVVRGVGCVEFRTGVAAGVALFLASHHCKKSQNQHRGTALCSTHLECYVAGIRAW